MARTYTDLKLSEPMLKRMAAMAARQPHNHGTSLTALQNRGLVQERTPRCPECGSAEIDWIDHRREDEWPQYADKVRCDKGHTSLRKFWGGCYQYGYELTELGRTALAAARAEGW